MTNPLQVYTPKLKPSAIAPPSREIFTHMGRDNIYRLLADFYEELGRSSIRPMFPADLSESSRRSAAFFVQILGGPPEYNELRGSPRMRARHLAVRISLESRAVWLKCFERILENAPAKYAFPAQHLPGFKQYLQAFSLWMVNAEDAAEPSGAGDP